MSKIVHPQNVAEYEFVINKSKACMVDFYTSWCVPCKKLGENLEKWIEKDNLFENVTVMKIDAENDNFDKLITTLGVERIPRIMLYKMGSLFEDVKEYPGVDAIKKKLENLNK